jgi:hypothetical protein
MFMVVPLGRGCYALKVSVAAHDAIGAVEAIGAFFVARVVTHTFILVLAIVIFCVAA